MLLASLRVGVPALCTGAVKEGKMRVVKGKADSAWTGRQNHCCSEQAAFLGHCSGEVKVSGQSKGRGKATVQKVPQVLFTTAACCTMVLKLLQIFSHVEEKTPKINSRSRTGALFPFSLHSPCFSNPKSVLCFTGKLIEDCVETRFSQKISHLCRFKSICISGEVQII